MSQADIETLRAGYEAVSRRDWDNMFKGAHPDIELETAARAPNAGTYHGFDQIKQFLEDQFGPFEEVTAEPVKFFDRGEMIAVLLKMRFRPTGSSAAVENRIGHLWTFRDGMALRLEIFPEREKALEAIGMSQSEARAEAA